MSSDGSGSEDHSNKGMDPIVHRHHAQRSRRVERLLSQGPRVTSRNWLQLIVLVLVLVLLFATRDEFGRRAAGCFGNVSGAGMPPATPAVLSEPAESLEETDAMRTPTVRVIRPQASDVVPP